MKRSFLVRILLLSLTITLSYGMARAASQVGQIAPSKAFSVNIIAYDTCPSSNNAQRIAVLGSFTSPVGNGSSTVNLDKTNLIFLTPGPDFEVLDSSACDSDGAVLQLPTDVSSTYDVWVRLVGKPNSGISVTSCAVLNSNLNTVVCNTGASVFVKTRNNGQPTFTNATKDLLFVNGTPLFDATFFEEFWVWDTTGNPHAQVWFIQP